MLVSIHVVYLYNILCNICNIYIYICNTTYTYIYTHTYSVCINIYIYNNNNIICIRMYMYIYIYTLIVLSRRIVRGDVSTCQQTQHWWLAVQSHTSVVVSVTPLRHLNSANSHRDGWSSVWILVTAENIHTAGQERRTSPPTSTQEEGMLTRNHARPSCPGPRRAQRPSLPGQLG